MDITYYSTTVCANVFHRSRGTGRFIAELRHCAEEKERNKPSRVLLQRCMKTMIESWKKGLSLGMDRSSTLHPLPRLVPIFSDSLNLNSAMK